MKSMSRRRRAVGSGLAKRNSKSSNEQDSAALAGVFEDDDGHDVREVLRILDPGDDIAVIRGQVEVCGKQVQEVGIGDLAVPERL